MKLLNKSNAVIALTFLAFFYSSISQAAFLNFAIVNGTGQVDQNADGSISSVTFDNEQGDITAHVVENGNFLTNQTINHVDTLDFNTLPTALWTIITDAAPNGYQFTLNSTTSNSGGSVQGIGTVQEATAEGIWQAQGYWSLTTQSNAFGDTTSNFSFSTTTSQLTAYSIASTPELSASVAPVALMLLLGLLLIGFERRRKLS